MKIDRRRFLAQAGGTAAAVAVGGSLLTACDTGGQTGPATDNTKVKLPNYIPYEGVKADIPAGKDGILAGYYAYPQDAKAAFSGKPGEGIDELTVLVNIFEGVPPTIDRNSYWQQLNERLGTKLNLNMVPDSSYQQKIQATLAGGDLPDIVQVRTDMPQRANVLKSLFTDLTEYLSGDSISDYPFLANIPTESWKPMVHNGGIYALPTFRAPVGSIMFVRDDLIAAKSLNREPKNFAEFLELCVGLTDAKKNQWAIASPASTVQFLAQMTGAPNTWREENGKFVNTIETEENKQALAAGVEMAKKGVFHPDSFGAKVDLRNWFGTGRIALNRDGYAAWDILLKTYPDAEIGGLVSPKYDGGGDAPNYQGATTFAFTAIKKSEDKERVRKLLRICDWLSAPFGTAEYLFRKFGTEGTHFTWKDGSPTLTATGKTETKLPLQYIVDAPTVLGPGSQEIVQRQREYQDRVVPKLVVSPSVGLYSDADTSTGAKLRKLVQDAQIAILQGRKDISSWDDTVKEWRTGGGDTIRGEYEKAFEAAK